MFYWIKNNNEETVSDLFKIQTNELSRVFNRFTVERSADIKNISLIVQERLQPKNAKLIEEILYNTLLTYKIYHNLFIIDQNKIKRFDTNKISIGNFSSYPFFDKAKKEKRSIFEFYYDPESKQEMLSFARALIDNKGNFRGVLVANVSNRSIANFAHTIIDSSLGKQKKEIEVIRPDGSILFSNSLEQKSNFELLHYATAYAKEVGKIQFIKNDDFFWSITRDQLNLANGNHQEVYFSIKLAKKNTHGIFYRLYSIVFAVFVLITAILTFIGYTIAKSISRPIEETARAISQMGEGNFSAIESIQTNDDDYGILIDHIKMMTKKLNLSIAEQTKKSRMASLGEMAGGIAHEINNPLQLISAHAHTLKRALKQSEIDHEKTDRSLKIISDTIGRIAKIICGLKSLSRDGSQDSFTQSSLDSIIDSTFLICSEKLKSNNIFIQVVKSEENISFDCRSVQISQVLLNLINNACDAIVNEENKWIIIEFSKLENELIFKITNSGPKISDEIASRLFTPFFTTKLEGSGTGLGLSISMAIIHSHKGSIEVELENEQTCFVVTLPLHQENKDQTLLASA